MFQPFPRLLASPWVAFGCWALLGACGEPPASRTVEPARIATTYRVLSGISMGAVGAATLGLATPDRFDGVAAEGGPLDAALLWRMIDRYYLSGFCSLADLESIAKVDPNRLNDPSVIDPCIRKPPRIEFEQTPDFNHFAYTTNGEFDRDRYWNLFEDLTLAYGSFFYENPRTPYGPPVDGPAGPEDFGWLRHPPPTLCGAPLKVKGLKNAEFNPEGKYDAITFCDGEPPLYFCKNDRQVVDFCADRGNLVTPLSPARVEPYAQSFCAGRGGFEVATVQTEPLMMLNHSGRHDPCRQPTRPITLVLAIDINGNGWRDYGEPVVAFPQEPFSDSGEDGCLDAFEDGEGGCAGSPLGIGGDPNEDDYDATLNPLGREGNGVWDEGEPFFDVGLDGLPGTLDFGEGNGQFDMTSGRRELLKVDPRRRYEGLDDKARSRLDLYLDGGLRDVFNFGLSAKALFGLVRHFRPDDSASYRDFTEIPGMVDSRTKAFRPWGARWEKVPKNLFVLYGKANPSDEDRVAGEGDHVGSIGQALNRVGAGFNWAASRWPSLPKPSAPLGGETYEKRAQILSFQSAALGGLREYGVFLPPGYDLAENLETRYPVLYLLHGYGMDPGQYMASSFLVDSYMKDPDVRFRPMILVFASGTCCFVNGQGDRDCRETQKAELRKRGFERECHDGTFYVNRKGYTAADSVRYGDAFYELMDEVESRFRVLEPADLEAR